jgi:hypothetical protein
MDLKLNIETYCGLLWTIFGDHCDYYKELLKIYRILDCEECFTIQHAYTKEVCACIRWAIVNDRRSFFGRNPVAFHFAAGLMFIFCYRIWRESRTPSGMQIPFRGQLSPMNGCLSLLWIPLTACNWQAHLQPIGETLLLRWPRPWPQLCSRHPLPPRRTCDIQKSTFLWIRTLSNIITF